MSDPLVNADLTFTYRILSTRSIDTVDGDWSRIFDDKYVLDGGCPDIENLDMGVMFAEYYGFIDDYSEGIKKVYFNTGTCQVEEHVFSGPVFEYYDAAEDELGSPSNFPDAMVQVRDFSGPPLKRVVDYDFMDDLVVRFRKKTFKELLPDRTFRTTKLIEMMSL